MGKIIKNGIEYTGGGTIQVSQLPVASADELGKIYQYIGATDATYTNGYFYKCEEITPATDPKTYKWTNIPVQQGGGGDVNFELDTTNDFAVIGNQNQAISFQLDDADVVTLIASEPNTYYNTKILATQDYVDSSSGAFVVDTSNPCSYNELQNAINAPKVILIKHAGIIYPFVEKWESDENNKRYVNIASLQRQGADKGAMYFFFEATIGDFDSPMAYSSNFAQPTGKPYTDSITGNLSNLTTTEKTNLVGAVNEVNEKAKAGILIEDTQEATIRNYDEPNNRVYFGFGEDNGVEIIYNHGEQRKPYFVLTSTQVQEYINSKAGMHLAVGKEKWYGTYEDENGEVFQVYSKTVYIPALPATAGITQYNHGVSNIKQILSIYGFTTDGFVLNAPRQTTSDNITIYQASKSASNQTFSIEVGKDRSSKKAYVTMIYAKNNA